MPNEKADNFIRFGLERDLGFYVDLEPGKRTEMISGLVPASTGADPLSVLRNVLLPQMRRN